MLFIQPSRTNSLNHWIEPPSTTYFHLCIPLLHFTFLPTFKHSLFKTDKLFHSWTQIIFSPNKKLQHPSLTFKTVQIQDSTVSHTSCKRQIALQNFWVFHSFILTIQWALSCLENNSLGEHFQFIVIWNTTVYWAPVWIKLNDSLIKVKS